MAGLLREVRTAVYKSSLTATLRDDGLDQFAEVSLTHRRAPLLLVLDEGNWRISRPYMTSRRSSPRGAVEGVVTLACLQDLSRPSHAADGKRTGSCSVWDQARLSRHRRYSDPRGGIAARR